MVLKISVPSATAIDLSYLGATKGKEAPEITKTVPGQAEKNESRQESATAMQKNNSTEIWF